MKYFEIHFVLFGVKLSQDEFEQAEPSWAKLSQAEPSWAKLSQAEPSWAKLSICDDFGSLRTIFQKKIFSTNLLHIYFLDSRQDQEGNFQKVEIGLKYCNSKVDI